MNSNNEAVYSGDIPPPGTVIDPPADDWTANMSPEQKAGLAKMTPEQREQLRIRAHHAAVFMADFNHELAKRQQSYLKQFYKMTGMPTRIMVSGSLNEQRMTKLVELLIGELSVMSVFQAKTYQRLLDIMEVIGEVPPEVSGNRDAKDEGRIANDEAASSALHEGRGSSTPGRTSDAADA